MVNIIVPDPAADAIREADVQAARAEDVVHQGHNGHGADERAGYAAVAQVHATLAAAAELRALRETLADVLGDIRDQLASLDD